MSSRTRPSDLDRKPRRKTRLAIGSAFALDPCTHHLAGTSSASTQDRPSSVTSVSRSKQSIRSIAFCLVCFPSIDLLSVGPSLTTMLRARTALTRYPRIASHTSLAPIAAPTALRSRSFTMSSKNSKNGSVDRHPPEHQHALKSNIPQPPPDAKEKSKKPFPDTGWEGELPSVKGGEYEKDYMNKPPYRWNSDKFEAKYTS